MNPPQGANSPTPRTDAASIDVSDIPELYCQVVRSDFARQLETEHAQLVARVASLREGLNDLVQANKHPTRWEVSGDTLSVSEAIKRADVLLTLSDHT